MYKYMYIPINPLQLLALEKMLKSSSFEISKSSKICYYSLNKHKC